MKVTLDAPQEAEKLIVREAKDGKQIETAVADPQQMAQKTRVVDAQDEQVQRAIREGAIEVVGTV